MNNLLKYKKYSYNKCIEYKISKNQLVIIPIENFCDRNFILLDEIAAEIYFFIKDNTPLENILTAFVHKYDISEQEFEKELNYLLNIFLNNKIIHIETENKKDELNFFEDIHVSNKEIYNLMYKTATNNNAPFKVFFELTYNCNLRCRHCYLKETISQNNNLFMSLKKFKNIIDELVEMNVVDIVLTGGECTLHNNFMEFLSYLQGKNLLITILSNGQLIDEETVKQMINIDIFDVRISFYGLQKTHNNFVNNKNAFEKSLNALKLLKKYKGIGTGVFLATKDNFNEIENFINIFKENNLNYEIGSFIYPTTEGDRQPINYRLDNDLKEFTDKYVDNCFGSHCSAGISRFRISPDGNVTPCELLKNIILGNVYKQSFKEIFQTGRVSWLKEFEEINKANECNKCELREFCSSCIGLSKVENNNYLKKVSYLCDVAKYKKKKYKNLFAYNLIGE